MEPPSTSLASDQLVPLFLSGGRRPKVERISSPSRPILLPLPHAILIAYGNHGGLSCADDDDDLIDPQYHLLSADVSYACGRPRSPDDGTGDDEGASNPLHFSGAISVTLSFFPRPFQ